MSKLEAARESLRSSSPATWHSARKAVEASASATTTSHLGTEHLHEDLGIDLHAAAHSTSTTEALHRVHEVFATVIACTFPMSH
jgi:hypothetical protein